MPALGLPVLVGLDDSRDSAVAAEAAAAEASRRQLPLRLVIRGPTPPTSPISSWRPVADPVELLDRILARLSTGYPGLEVIAEAYQEDLAGFLVDESEHASLIVVGPGQTGGYDRLSRCWIAHLVDTRAFCPVLVARADTAFGNRHPGPRDEEVIALGAKVAVVQNEPAVAVGPGRDGTFGPDPGRASE